VLMFEPCAICNSAESEASVGVTTTVRAVGIFEAFTRVT
jgi:hypothetical protein